MSSTLWDHEDHTEILQNKMTDMWFNWWWSCGHMMYTSSYTCFVLHYNCQLHVLAYCNIKRHWTLVLNIQLSTWLCCLSGNCLHPSKWKTFPWGIIYSALLLAMHKQQINSNLTSFREFSSHFSNCWLWKKTEHNNAETLLQAPAEGLGTNYYCHAPYMNTWTIRTDE